MSGDSWGTRFPEDEIKFTVAYNGTDDLFYLRAGSMSRDGGTIAAARPVVLETQPAGMVISPMFGLTHKEAENLANALAMAGVFSTIDNANQQELNTNDNVRADPGLATIRAMKAHIRDLQKILFGEEK